MRLPQPVLLVGLLVAALGLLADAFAPVHAARAAAPRKRTAAPVGLPLTAAYRDGMLVLSYDVNGDRLRFIARWPVEDVPADSHAYRASRLQPLDAAAGPLPDLSSATAVPVRGREEWDRIVTEVMVDLAPRDEHEAALTRVQGEDVVFYLTPAGELRLCAHEDKPADRRVTRVVGEAEFAAQADAVLRMRFVGEEVLLFHAGDDPGDESFVLFDLSRRQSVLIAGLAANGQGDLPQLLHMLVRVPDTLIVRGQALGVLTRPVSSIGRLMWLVSQSALKLVPPRYVGRDAPVPPLAEGAEMDVDAWNRDLDSMGLSPVYRGSIAPLIDGQAFFTELVQALQDAESSISIRLFIFDNDDYALQIADLLKRRASEVRIRVLIDAMGTLGASQAAPEGAATGAHALSIARYLRADSKIEVRETPNPWLVADHTKSIIVDRRIAYLGGMNIGHEYRYQWHDMMVALEGPIVGRLQHDFDVAWAYAGFGGDVAYLSALGGREKFRGDTERSDYVDLRPLYTRTLDPEVLRVQLAAMQRARKAIWVEQPYVADDTLIAALIDARARGVDVRLIVPTRGDSRFMNSANLLAASALIRNGVRVYVYPGMTHVKAALYDGWACLGSANFDKLSLRVNRETNVATADPVFVGRLRQELFEADFAVSRELAEAPAAGWGTYISAYVAGQL